MTATNSELDDQSHGNEQHVSHLVHGVVQFLRVARHRKRVYLVTGAVVAILGTLYFATATRYYDADTSLLVLRTGDDSDTPTMGVDTAKSDPMPTYERLFHSAVVLEDAIKRLRPESRIDFAGVPREEWVNTLDRNLTPTAIRKTNIIEVRYRSRDPVVSVEVVKAVRDAYFDFVERTYQHTATEIIDLLTREQQHLEATLKEKQAELLAAGQTYGDLGIRRGGQVVHPLVQRALLLNDALVQVMEKRVDLEAALAGVRASISRHENLQPHLLALEGVVGREMLLSALGFSERDTQVQAALEKSLLTDRALLESMKEYLGPSHPKYLEVAERIHVTENYLTGYRDRIKKTLSEMQDTQLGPMIVEILDQSLTRASQQEQALGEQFEAARKEAVQSNGGVAVIETLEHDVDRLRTMQDTIINKIASANLWQQHGDLRVAIVEEPQVPTMPASPRLSFLIVICVLATGIGGSVIVWVQDSLDDRFRSPEELRNRLGVQTLAIIRALPDQEEIGLAGVQAFAMPDSVESEAFRTLRAALAFGSQESSKLVISSAEPGDGKTTVLVNLAVSLAQAGKRTLLIDADLRRPGLTSLLAMKRTAGLSDILYTDGPMAETAEQCVHKTELEFLDVIASGPRRPNPAELLSSPRLADLLAWAENRYDQILIDAPPVLAASDVLIAGRLVDGAVLVVQPEKNRRRVVIRAVESFHAVGVPLLGIVANRVSENGGLDDAYTYGYGYSYQYGVSADEETEEEEVVEEESDSYEEYGDGLVDGDDDASVQLREEEDDSYDADADVPEHQGDYIYLDEEPIDGEDDSVEGDSESDDDANWITLPEVPRAWPRDHGDPSPRRAA